MVLAEWESAPSSRSLCKTDKGRALIGGAWRSQLAESCELAQCRGDLPRYPRVAQSPAIEARGVEEKKRRKHDMKRGTGHKEGRKDRSGQLRVRVKALDPSPPQPLNSTPCHTGGGAYRDCRKGGAATDSGMGPPRLGLLASRLSERAAQAQRETECVRKRVVRGCDGMLPGGGSSGCGCNVVHRVMTVRSYSTVWDSLLPSSGSTALTGPRGSEGLKAPQECLPRKCSEPSPCKHRGQHGEAGERKRRRCVHATALYSCKQQCTVVLPSQCAAWSGQ